MRVPHQAALLPRLSRADRKSLLLGTALASTLLIGALLSPSPASAVVTCPPAAFPAPGPITIANPGDDIVCTNVFDRYTNAGSVIGLATNAADEYISLNNRGELVVTGAAGVLGILTITDGSGSFIEIVNRGDITADSGIIAFGISARTYDANSPIDIVNRGDIAATGDTYRAYGIHAHVFNDDSDIEIRNSGDIAVTGGGFPAYGITARTGTVVLDAENSSIVILNGGDVSVITGGDGAYAYGIQARTFSDNSPIAVVNSGDMLVITTSGDDADAYGILARALGDNTPIEIRNRGNFLVSTAGYAADANAILAVTPGETSPVAIENSGDIAVRTTGDDADTNAILAATDGLDSPALVENSGNISVITAGNDAGAYGISVLTFDGRSRIEIENVGDIAVTAREGDAEAAGILARTTDNSSRIEIANSGRLAVRAGNSAYGITGVTLEDTSSIDIVNRDEIAVITRAGPATAIRAFSYGRSSPVEIENKGDLVVTSLTSIAFGINTYTGYHNSPIAILNAGNITASGAVSSYGISAVTDGDLSPVDIVNSAKITAGVFGIYAATSGAASPIAIFNSGVIDPEVGMSVTTLRPDSPIEVENVGSVYGDLVGIKASSPADTTITNSGEISAASLKAIVSYGPGDTKILNSGVIKGYIVLDADDTFINRNGGVFEAKLTSDFGPGEDLFKNEGAVHATALGADQTSIVNLERFENSGIISLVDGDVGDVFTITGTDLHFVASRGSILAVDAFLGSTGVKTDKFIIDGDVTGKTMVTLNNTRPGGGVFNPDGIPVVFVNGQVLSNVFYMKQPFDSGLFDWDLYFVKTGSGFFELRSFPGGGAHVLPQLLTAVQDVFHSTNETWFDRTADLRVLLNGGVPLDGGRLTEGAQVSTSFAPAIWIKGSGTWLNQEDNATSSAYGRTYRYNLNRDLDVANFEGGVDFGKRGVLSEGDALVFGVLGGAVLGNLDYDQLVRRFHIEGGKVGGYVTYLKGGLFVDNLVKVDLLEFDTNGAPGLPGSLDATAWGFRTDTGYRFGGFKGGLFVEPLATIAVVWSDIDNFALGGNKVTFDDEANVRGRLGLRFGTSREVWSGIVMEPFVIGSVWGTLSGENEATVTSLGTRFGPFTDAPDDVWGVVSTGVNFFSPGTQTSLFAKFDVIFGEETDGIGAKAGMRYSW